MRRRRRRTRRWWTAARSAAFDGRPTPPGSSSCVRCAMQRGIVLIFDEVFVGFRLAPGGAQDYFGVRADLVTYGKTLGGGLPIGVVCGRRHLMKRYRDDRPVDVCFARGTFNSHPYVMGAMHEFLQRMEDAGYPRRCTTTSTRCGPSGRRRSINVCGTRAAGRRSSTCRRSGPSCYTQPSRYNWMLQYYLRGRGAGAQLDRYRPPDLQPELHGSGLPGRCRPLRRPPPEPCIGTAGGGPTQRLTKRRSSGKSCARCARSC